MRVKQLESQGPSSESRHSSSTGTRGPLSITTLILMGTLMVFSLLAGCGDLSSDSDEATSVLSGVIGTLGDGPESLKVGVSAFSASNYQTAASEFANVAASGSASNYDKSVARAGLGWVSVRNNDLETAYASFKQGAALSIDAALGMVMVAVESYSADKIQEAVSAIETLGGRDTSRTMSFSIPHGVSESQARCLLACLYGYIGDTSSGKYQYARATQLNAGEAAQFIGAMRVLNTETE